MGGLMMAVKLLTPYMPRLETVNVPPLMSSRVSVVSTIGYAAFLAGPPFLGFVGDEVGTLKALLVVAVLLMPAALVVPAAREQRAPDPAVR